MSMKTFAVVLGLFLAAWPATSVIVRRGSRGSLAEGGKRTITQVVDMLQGMLDTSRQEAKDERALYAKYKCYCDDNAKAKNEAIEQATKTIAQLENQVEELLGSNGELSVEVAKLKSGMDKNEQVRNEATTLRGNEKDAFEAEEADLQTAVGQLNQSIEVLAAIGADQSMASAAHQNFMAGYGEKDTALAGLRSSVKQALLAARAVVSPAQERKLRAFLQEAKAPFTGTYVSQSGEVVGILKQIKETFETNLAEAQAAEAAAETAHGKFIATKENEFNTMKDAHDEKVGTMGSNDGDLGTIKPLLADSKTQKQSDIEFLAQLSGMCGEKATEYEKRELLRTKEEAALSQAIAILNNDVAFEAFGKVKATSEGATGFLQISAESQRLINRRMSQQAALAAKDILQEAARKQKSKRLAGVARLLTLGNPFTRVLEEIVKIKEVIAAEATQDQNTLNWCNSERSTSDSSLQDKTGQIADLRSEITALEDHMHHPETGLVKFIADREERLEQNRQAQTEQTEARREENIAFQKEVANCQDSVAILNKAITLLEKYYQTLQAETAEPGLVQEDPSPPQTWDGEFVGQSGQGAEVITMLKFVLSETAVEEKAAHESELTAQHAYEDGMTSLKSEEEEAQGELVGATKELAEKKLELAGKQVDLDATEQEKLAIERYLQEIKPGCDFITDNFDDREASRAAEEGALDNAVALIKATPAFAAAGVKDQEDAWGACKATCQASEAHVDCQACLKKVSVPGYCAGHPDTPGCSQ